MHGLIRSIPTYKWLLVLPQLTSRMCHVQPDVQVTGTRGVRECGDTAWTDTGSDACVAVPWLAGSLVILRGPAAMFAAASVSAAVIATPPRLLPGVHVCLHGQQHCTGCAPAADDCCALCGVSMTPLITSCRSSCSSCWWPLCSSSLTRPSGPWLSWSSQPSVLDRCAGLRAGT